MRFPFCSGDVPCPPCCAPCAAAAAAPGSPAPATSYDDLEDTPGQGPSAGATGQEAEEAGLVVEPRCSDMCPAAERQQRTTDKQLHEFERVEGQEYATDADHAVKKYTRSGGSVHRPSGRWAQRGGCMS